MSNNYNPQEISQNHYKLDVKGLTCPYPQVLVTRALDQLSPEDTLEVVLNNPPSARDIPPALRDRGYEASDAEALEQNTWKIIVKKK